MATFDIFRWHNGETGSVVSYDYPAANAIEALHQLDAKHDYDLLGEGVFLVVEKSHPITRNAKVFRYTPPRPAPVRGTVERVYR